MKKPTVWAQSILVARIVGFVYGSVVNMVIVCIWSGFADHLWGKQK